MNAPSPSSQRPVTLPTNSAVNAPAIVLLESDARPAANHDTITAVPDHSVNPLWMITAGLAIFFATLAILVSTS
jgi:hypothetical protein